MILLTPWTQSPIPDAEDLWVILFVLLVPIVGWLGLRCWSAYIEQKVEQRGTEAGQRQARTALDDRLMQLTIGLVLLVCIWLLNRSK